MAKKNEVPKIYRKDGVEYNGLMPLNTMVELVGTKGEKVHRKVMSLDDALCTKEVNGWRHQIFQINFCSTPENK